MVLPLFPSFEFFGHISILRLSYVNSSDVLMIVCITIWLCWAVGEVKIDHEISNQLLQAKI